MNGVDTEWRRCVGRCDSDDIDTRAPRWGKSKHYETKSERERKRKTKRRKKRARTHDRRRVREVEAKYGYYAYHSCTSKRRYPTLERALGAAVTSDGVFGVKHYVYHCKLCGGYHLTTHRHGDKRDETIRDTGAVEGGRAENQGN